VTSFATVFLSLLIALVVSSGVTIFVSYRVQRASSVSTRAATQRGVSFVVSARRWQSGLLRGCGILLVAVGCLLLLVAILAPGQQGPGIAGAIIALGGIGFMWLGHGVRRARLEVTPDSVWVIGWTGAPKQIPVQQITRLGRLLSNNYGGIVARSGERRLFSASRIMLGYPQLIGYLRMQRPDLTIPVGSLPLNTSGSTESASDIPRT
jgi:hypothetical protein